MSLFRHVLLNISLLTPNYMFVNKRKDSVQIGSGTHPASCSVGTRLLSLG